MLSESTNSSNTSLSFPRHGSGVQRLPRKIAAAACYGGHALQYNVVTAYTQSRTLQYETVTFEILNL